VTQLLAITHSQPGNGEAYIWLAQAYSGLGQKEKALAAANRARALEKQEKPH
jgi:predicted Zn-dependent protease